MRPTKFTGKQSNLLLFTAGVAFALFSSSCGNPKTAAEYRKFASSSMWGKVDKYTTTQNYANVVQILKKRALSA